MARVEVHLTSGANVVVEGESAEAVMNSLAVGPDSEEGWTSFEVSGQGRQVWIRLSQVTHVVDTGGRAVGF